MNIAALPDTSRIGPHVHLGRIDAELAALVGLLAANGISLVVAAPPDGRSVAGDLLAALDAARTPVDMDALGDGNRALLRAASRGVGFAATIEATSLDDAFGRLRAMAGLSDDERDAVDREQADERGELGVDPAEPDLRADAGGIGQRGDVHGTPRSARVNGPDRQRTAGPADRQTSTRAAPFLTSAGAVHR